MKLNIAFDLDGCLIDFRDALCQTLSEIKKVTIDQDEYRIKTTPSVSNQQMAEAFRRTYKLTKRTKFFDGAIEFCETLHAKSQQPILIVTSRPVWCSHHTHRLIKENLQTPYIIAFADPTFGKNMYLSGIKYFVEDNKNIAQQLVACDKTVFMPNCSYNKMPTHPNIYRINNFNQLLKYVDKFIK